MDTTKKILQGLAIPYSSLVSIIFGMMLLSFPVGAYLVYNSDIGDEINFQYPISEFAVFFAWISLEIPVEFELGDGFIILWCIYAILFSIAMMGPTKNFIATLSPTLTRGIEQSSQSYIVATIKWFSILILASTVIAILQQMFGIVITPPESSNDLIQFFDITNAPLIEEIGFRILLIGLPLYLIYSHKTTVKHFLKSLWHPERNLDIYNKNKVMILVGITAVIFGIAHILSAESWSDGKFLQAAVGGAIIGWVYFRYGLVCAILIHWATNYFIFSYIHIIAQLNASSTTKAIEHGLIGTMEIIFIVTGIISLAIVIVNHIKLTRDQRFLCK